jgi:hypothetical protein
MPLRTNGPIAPALALTALLLSPLAHADAQVAYADPPPDHEGRRYVASDNPPPDPPSPVYRSSAVRPSVGTAARVTSDSFHPGLTAAVDFGRGPAGLRLSGTWVHVGYSDPLSQYTAELTLDFLAQSRLVPHFGAGAGIARTYAVDASGARASGGATLGIGVLRAALDYRLPLDDADARAGISVLSALPAIKADNAPRLDPWFILAATVGVGF